MAARKVLVGFAVLALGVGITASVATAFSPCGHRTCSEAVAASGLSRHARGACRKRVIADCRAGLCSCTGGSPPCSCVCGDGLCGPSEDCSTCSQDCGQCPTTTTTTTLPCSICFVTVTDQCLGPCSTSSDCGPPQPNVLCLPVTELQSIGVCRANNPFCPPEACECPRTTTTTTTTLPCSICFSTVSVPGQPPTAQCLGPCSRDNPCPIEPNILCLPVTELQRIGFPCECPTP